MGRLTYVAAYHQSMEPLGILMVHEAVLLLLVMLDLISVTFDQITVGFGYPWFEEMPVPVTVPVRFPATG